MLEMQIISPKEHQRFPDIVWNFDELKTGIESAMADYKNLVVVPESEREFKDTRAKLNKLYQAIETARKSMKEKVMEPLVKFEGEVKQVEAPIVECIDNIDVQLKEIDQIRKDRKRGEIEAAFDGYVSAHPDFPEYLDFKRLWSIWNPGKREPWLNKTCTMETILGQIEQTAETCRKSIATLEKLPECGFEAIQYYKITLDLDASIRKASEMAEIQRKKAEAEAEKPKTTPAAPQNEPVKAVETPKKGPAQETQKDSRTYTFVFETTVSIEQAKTLGDFCRANGIPLKNLTGKVKEV
jgi:hypothetical protein